MSNVKKALSETKEVLYTKWSPRNLRVPSWAISFIIWLTVARAVSYGLELILLSDNVISGILAYATLFGVENWGIAILLAVCALIIGMITKNNMIVTIGSLLCMAVWLGFSVCMGIGWLNVGSGGRFFISALVTALTWMVFFMLQLKSIKRNGAPDETSV